MSVFKSILTNSTLAFSIKLFGAALSFFVTLLITKNSSVSESGIFFLSLSIVTFLLPIGLLGLNTTLLKIIPTELSLNRLDKVNEIFGKTSIFCLIVSVTITFLMYLNIDIVANYIFEKSELEIPLSYMVFSLPFMVLCSLHSHACQSVGMVAKSIFTSGSSTQLFFLLLLFFIGVNGNHQISMFYLFATIISALLALYFWFSSSDKKIAYGYDSKKIINFAKPIFSTQIIAIVNVQIGVLMLGAWASAEDVALFSVCFRIAAIATFIMIAVNRVVAPDFSALYSQGRISELGMTVKYSTRILTCFSLLIMIFTIIFSSQLLSLFGEQYTVAKPILIILSITQCINVVTGNASVLLQMTGNAKYHRNNVFFATLVTIILGVIFIPAYGIYGAAIMSLVGLSLVNFLNCYQVKKILGINTLKII